MRVDRQTDRQTDKQTYSSQYLTHLPGRSNNMLSKDVQSTVGCNECECVACQMVDGSMATLLGDVWTARQTQADRVVCPSTRSRPADRARGLAV